MRHLKLNLSIEATNEDIDNNIKLIKAYNKQLRKEIRNNQYIIN